MKEIVVSLTEMNFVLALMVPCHADLMCLSMIWNGYVSEEVKYIVP